MKTFLFTLVTFLFCSSGICQDVETIVKEAERLEAIPDETGAYHKLKEALAIKPNHVHALAKCSEMCSRIGKRQKDATLRDDYYKAAKIYAETALKFDPNNSEANCSMAIALGRTTMSKSGKEKMITAREIRKYVDLAIKSDPNNFLAWHVLGRWHYEISSLSFVERAAVKVFYGGLPPSSFKEAIAAFEKSEALTPGFCLNYFELARAYQKNGDHQKAIDTLSKLATLPNRTEDDTQIKTDGKKMLMMLQQLRN